MPGKQNLFRSFLYPQNGTGNYEPASKSSRSQNNQYKERRTMRVALGSDHGGFELKQEIIKYLEEKKVKWDY